MDILEFKRIIALGGRVSEKHEFFKEIAKLGYDEARETALVKFWIWFMKHPKASVEKMYLKYLELMGMANFLPNSKEITRLSMIMGDTTKIEDY
jgi:hypothetical protein